MKTRAIVMTINGHPRRVEAEPARTLLGILRDDLALTGTKYGCGEGRCGACTVLVDGRAVRSCQTSIGDVAGKTVTTIEGLESADGRLHPVQQAFLDQEAFQCGYCTPGMIVNAVGLLADLPGLSDDEILEGMQGNVCRCGTYRRIVAAIRQAAGPAQGGAK